MNHYSSETLIEQQQEIEKLKEQNAALAATVEALRSEIVSLVSTVFKTSKALIEATETLERELLPALEDSEPLIELIEEFKSVVAATPQHHLRQVRADAGRKAHFDGYMLGYEHAMSNKEKCEPAVYAAEYHASILAGKE